MTKNIEINATTGKETIREMTESEIESQILFADKEAERETTEKKAAKSKSALLEKLGISDEEAKLLLS